MRAPALLAFAALAVGALACRAERPRAPAAATTSPSHATMTDPAPDSLALELVLPRSVRRGETVPVAFRIRNTAGRTLDLYLRGRTPTFDVIVARSGGQVVWRRLEGEIVPAIVHLRALAPGEHLELAALWDQRTSRGPIAPGEYTARGMLLVEGEPLETPDVPFGVGER